MRLMIAHADPEHPLSEPFAYRLGAIDDRVDVVTGEVTPAADVLEQLLAAAAVEYPEADGFAHTVED